MNLGLYEGYFSKKNQFFAPSTVRKQKLLDLKELGTRLPKINRNSVKSSKIQTDLAKISLSFSSNSPNQKRLNITPSKKVVSISPRNRNLINLSQAPGVHSEALRCPPSVKPSTRKIKVVLPSINDSVYTPDASSSDFCFPKENRLKANTKKPNRSNTLFEM